MLNDLIDRLEVTDHEREVEGTPGGYNSPWDIPLFVEERDLIIDALVFYKEMQVI